MFLQNSGDASDKNKEMASSTHTACSHHQNLDPELAAGEDSEEEIPFLGHPQVKKKI